MLNDVANVFVCVCAVTPDLGFFWLTSIGIENIGVTFSSVSASLLHAAPALVVARIVVPQKCAMNGFHQHAQPNLYQHAQHVSIDPVAANGAGACKFIDLRG